MDKLEQLKEQLKSYQKVAIAYSGGCDSHFLYTVAKQTLGKENVLAVICFGDMMSKEDIDSAKALLSDDHYEVINIDVSIIDSLCLFEGEPHRLINKAAIKSALGNQYQPYSRRELAYASVYKSLVLDHGFMNGNKRTAVITLYIVNFYLPV